uniref:Reverse transcriptase domain-containing protein n=1 Tax=Tanacetum cinerariifolium TaxID=118510 RepID=A0A6L2JVZ1_TANCI|nr:reverse transcriptase domain-containing protein [Tanacetum cinerariifolium]
MQRPKHNKTTRRHNGPKPSPGQTGYGPEAARQTKGFQMTLSQGSESQLGKPKGRSVSARSNNQNQCSYSRYTEALSESEDSGGGHWKSRSKKKKSSREEDDLSQPWGVVAASNHEPKKSFPPWKQQEGHNTDECMHLKKQIEEMLKAGKLSHLIKELRQNNGKEQPKAAKKGRNLYEGQSISHPNDEEEGTEGPMITEAEIGGHCMHRMYVDGGSASKILANTTTSKDWRRRTLRFGLDEFRGGKVTISVQRNYWKTRSQETASSSVNSSRNAETPGGRMSNYHKKHQHDGNWRMCVDFKDLNKACPKDGYPLPEIDWKVESLCGFPFKYFLDAYKGYHQIQMAKEYEEKIAFITSQGIFCYTKMPFGLRNTRETYQRLVDNAFHKQIGRNLKVYMDDLVIKSRTKDEIVRDIEERFKTLRSGRGVQENETANSGASHANRTNGKRRNLSSIWWQPKKRPRVSVKGQILANFIVKRPKEDSPNTLMEVEELPEPWILFTDGSSCTDGSGARLILINPEGMEFTYALRFRFDATNNEVEYKALIARLRIAEQIGVKNLQANVDSRLVANQVNGTYVAKEVDMIRYLKKVRTLTNCFKVFSIKQVPISENKKVDARSKIASTSFTHLRPLQANYVMRVIREGSCRMHASTWSVVAKALRIGNPLQKLTPITSPWPFYKWRIDIAGHFLEGPGKVKFLIVAIDYFTKWIEAKPITTITGSQIKKFMQDNIVCRFGLLREIISDNGKQFQDNPFKDWREKLCIRQHFAFIKHPQTNGLVERANHSLGEGIKSRLDAKSNNWMEELPHVLWAHHTMIKSSNGDTPFLSIYGTKAIILAEIGMPTL